MKTSLTISLILLGLLVYEAQGIRLEKWFMPNAENKFQKEENSLTKRINNDGGKEAILCSKDDQQCSGNNRKLDSVTFSTTSTTVSKNNNNTKHRVDPNSNGVNSFNPDHQQKEATTNENYSDFVDIVEMDYSPAKRKSPVHN